MNETQIDLLRRRLERERRVRKSADAMAGMNDYIVKPLDLFAVYATMARWFIDGRA